MTQPTEKQGNHAITIGPVFLAICQHYRAKTMRHGGRRYTAVNYI